MEEIKELKIIIPRAFWKEIKEALGEDDEKKAEYAARSYMHQALLNKVRDHKHPETGLAKQEMVHYRRGETDARAWLHGNKEATREEFEQAGKIRARHAGSMEHTRELILKGWMSVWKD
jgi:hypothetical protein